MSVYDYIEIDDNAEKLKYTVIQSVRYHSKRYNKDIIADVGFKSDGATGALDIDSFGWLFHDILCATGEFAGSVFSVGAGIEVAGRDVHAALNGV